MKRQWINYGKKLKEWQNKENLCNQLKHPHRWKYSSGKQKIEKELNEKTTKAKKERRRTSKKRETSSAVTTIVRVPFLTRTFDLICFRFSLKSFVYPLYHFLWLTHIRNRSHLQQFSSDSSWFLLPPQKAKFETIWSATFVHFNWENFSTWNNFNWKNFWEVCTLRLVCIFTPNEMFARRKKMGKGCSGVHLISVFFCFCFKWKIRQAWYDRPTHSILSSILYFLFNYELNIQLLTCCFIFNSLLDIQTWLHLPCPLQCEQPMKTMTRFSTSKWNLTCPGFFPLSLIKLTRLLTRKWIIEFCSGILSWSSKRFVCFVPSKIAARTLAQMTKNI